MDNDRARDQQILSLSSGASSQLYALYGTCLSRQGRGLTAPAGTPFSQTNRTRITYAIMGPRIRVNPTFGRTIPTFLNIVFKRLL